MSTVTEKTVFCEIGDGRIKKIKFTASSEMGDAEALRQSLIKAAERDSHLHDKIHDSRIILQHFLKKASLYVDIQEDDDIIPNSVMKVLFLKASHTVMEVLSLSSELSNSSNNSLSSKLSYLSDENNLFDLVLDLKESQDIPVAENPKEEDINLKRKNEDRPSTSGLLESKRMQKVHSVS